MASNGEGVGLSVPEHLYRALKAALLEGTYLPGDELRQEVLANKYGVSRVPLREAMSRLQAEGLIILRPRRGYAVVSLDIGEITEIFELRMVVEQHAMEVATRMRSEADVRDVAALLEEMEVLRPGTPNYLSNWLDINRRFHDRLIASGERQRLYAVACNLRDTTEPYVRLDVNAAGQVDDPSGEHRELFEAFRARDFVRAGEISRDHCLNSMRRLLDGIRQRESKDRRSVRSHRLTKAA